MEERLNNLESITAMQDETIARLNEELYHQQRSIGRLQQRIEILESRLADRQPANPIGGNEKPPHY